MVALISFDYVLNILRSITLDTYSNSYVFCVRAYYREPIKIQRSNKKYLYIYTDKYFFVTYSMHKIGSTSTVDQLGSTAPYDKICSTPPFDKNRFYVAI